MTMNHQGPVMTTMSGQKLALQDMQVRIDLESSFAFITQIQDWKNHESINIEAIYSFPLPVRATLLGVLVRLNERVVVSEVTEARQAENTYEEALIDGDTAMLLEKVEPGLFNLNLGNLLPGDIARVEIRYSLPLEWEGTQLRLALPTTVAPRFGVPGTSGLQPTQVPEASMLVENAFSLEMRVTGALADARFSSPSHDITQVVRADYSYLHFTNGKAFANRDLVIVVESNTQPLSNAHFASANGVNILHSVFPIPAACERHPLNLKVLVDCSGSMAGDSIQLARTATLRVLHSLEPNDRFALTAFGSNVVHAPGNQERMQTYCNESDSDPAITFAQQLDANLGGTELLPALYSIFHLTESEAENNPADLLLITDGETWQRDALVRLCRKYRHRIFIIGCGACPAESVVREIAEATGGSSVFISAKEDVTSIVDRHLDRMRQPRIQSARLSLPGQLWQSPADLTRCTFAASTLHVFSAVQSRPENNPVLDVLYTDGQSLTLSANIENVQDNAASDLVRTGIDTYIRESVFNSNDIRADEVTTLAVKHQLISPYTHYIMVEHRGSERASDDPQIRKIPGMLAAGWGGTGAAELNGRLEMPMFMRRAEPDPADKQFLSMKMFKSKHDDLESVKGFTHNRQPCECTPADLARDISQHLRYSIFKNKLPVTFGALNAFLEQYNIVLPIDKELRVLTNSGLAEELVLIGFWKALLEHPELSDLFDRPARRAILRLAKKKRVSVNLLDQLKGAFTQCTADEWNWSLNHQT